MEKVTPDNGITIIENYVKLPATPEKIKEEKNRINNKLHELMANQKYNTPEWNEYYAAQAAFGWVQDPNWFASPYDYINKKYSSKNNHNHQ